ncbi:MAG: folylpolyglutamate synthase/dihydrofolate synthase family protein [Candidatus Neomarinimicrobiota bacterium]
MSPPSTSPETDKILNYLYGLQRRGIKVGLEHTLKLLKGLGCPQDNFKTIHLAGTNGKGSTSAMLASILRQAGYKVGLYTSPHLLNFNERIRINGRPISNADIVSFIRKNKGEIEFIESTFFETATALAFSYFAARKVDVAVVETGLGGRLDSTNVINPAVTVITPIALDHREILGGNLESITREKAGIIKPGIPLVATTQTGVVMDILESTARACSAAVIKVKYEKNSLKNSQGGIHFIYKNHPYDIPLLGSHQALNGAAAIEAALQFDNTLKVSTIRKGLEMVIWPGRLQRMSKDLPIYYDVAHNAQGLLQIQQLMSELFSQKMAVLLVLKGDKEIDLITRALQGEGPLIVSGSEEKGLMAAHDLAYRLKSEGLKRPFIVEQNFNKGLDRLISHVKTQGGPGLILGSHYIAGSVFSRFRFSFSNQKI